MIKLSTLVLSILFMSHLAQAKILVISDIDDTIKVSHILSKTGAVSSVLDHDSDFVGMSDIYRSLNLVHQDIEFHYVSLAPKVLMKEQHQKFLEHNIFPVTQLHLNPEIWQDPQFKQKAIKKLLAEKNPELVIYFGDNGQFDTVVYDDMVQEFPQIPQFTYIREAYSSKARSKYPTKKGQIGFVTAVEVALDLIQKNLLPLKAYSAIEQKVYLHLEQNPMVGEIFGEIVFPRWQDCRDFVWQWEVLNPSYKLLQIKQAIEQRCNSQYLADY